ncbi:Serine/threonine-protein kinase Nek8 [Halotydeus destructor]|nr:Serine/threonine-protein kinase Nek8 [Halotydeus destructor]
MEARHESGAAMNRVRFDIVQINQSLDRSGQNQFGEHDWTNHHHNYDFLRVVGKGAYGTVSLYRKKPDSSLIVMKEINMHELSTTDRVLAFREADLLSNMDHPNIVHYINKYENHGNLLIEMEFCDGGTLADFLCQLTQPLKEFEILIIFQQIVSAISYLHDRNIIHRDLKTANIFITQKTVIKVGDLGIAKVVSTHNPYATSVIGTPWYISPEMCEGKRYTKKTDIWALGCILYEIVCLHKTFEGSTLPALINKIVKVKYQPIRTHYSDTLKQLVTDLLQKEPDRRPYAYEVQDTVADLVYKTQISPFADYKSNMELFSGAITNGAGQGLQQMQSSLKQTRSIVYKLHLKERHVSLSMVNIARNQRIKHIAKGANHFLAVTHSFEVFVWGSNSHGQLGVNSSNIKRLETPAAIEALRRNITKVAAGDDFSIFLSNNGLVMSCGKVSSGCLGNILKNDCHELKFIDSLITTDVEDICSGPNHVLALTKSGEVYAWGANKDGRLGVESDRVHFVPVVNLPSLVRFPANVRIEKIFCGADCSIFIDDKGFPWASGSNSHNKLGIDELSVMRKISHAERSLVPERVKLVKHPVESVHIGLNNVCFVLKDNRIFVLGSNDDAQHCCGHCDQVARPVTIRQMADHVITKTACGTSFIMASTSKNELYFWGSRYHNRESESRKADGDNCSLNNPDYIKVGTSDMTLMDIVEKIGPDFPVIQLKDPKVIIDDVKQLHLLPSSENGVRCDIILKPQLIVALYCSQVHLQYGETISLSDLYCFDDDHVYVVFDTTIGLSRLHNTMKSFDAANVTLETSLTDNQRLTAKIKSLDLLNAQKTPETQTPELSPMNKTFGETTEVPDWMKNLDFVGNPDTKAEPVYETVEMTVHETQIVQQIARCHSFPLTLSKDFEIVRLEKENAQLRRQVGESDEKCVLYEKQIRELQNEMSRLRKEHVKKRKCVIC